MRKRLLAMIFLLASATIAGQASAVPVAIQRSGPFGFRGDDPAGTWNIMLFFDDSALADNLLDQTELTDWMITTTDGNILPGALYTAADTLDPFLVSISFLSGTPVLDSSQLIIYDTGSPNVVVYVPGANFTISEGNQNLFREGLVGPSQADPGAATWWSFKTLDASIVPEPVTAALLPLALGTLLPRSRRRRLA